MGGFPEDHNMRVSKIIKLWVAEGFLKPNGSNKSFKKIAEEYLEDLVKRSLVSVTKRKSNGRIKSFSMHDLMWEMCIRKALEENFILHLGQFDDDVQLFLQEAIKVLRRISISYHGLDFVENDFGLTIRTIIHVWPRFKATQFPFGYFRLLKILDLSIALGFFNYGNSFPTSLPVEFFELFHLSFLACDFPFLISASISNLQNLQTLIIHPNRFYHPRSYIELPVEIWRMSQLRHLVFCFDLLVSFEEGATFALENLQTLLLVRNFICSQKILKLIPNLKKLGISFMRWEDSEEIHEDYQLHNLKYLQQLENSKLEICPSFPCPEKVTPVFPMSLKNLTLSGWGLLSRKDLNTVGSLPNLEVLKLRDYACSGFTWETDEGEFSQLKFLLIDNLDLQNWITESSHFPVLKCLVLHRCWFLNEIPNDIGEIPTLELIEVDDRNKPLMDSAKMIQDDQQSNGNDALKVNFVKSF